MSTVPTITYTELITATVRYLTTACYNVDSGLSGSGACWMPGWWGDSSGTSGAWDTAVGGDFGKRTLYRYIYGYPGYTLDVPSSTVSSQLTAYITSKSASGADLGRRIQEGSFLTMVRDLALFCMTRTFFLESKLPNTSKVSLLIYNENTTIDGTIPITVPGDALTDENVFKMITADDVNKILDSIVSGITTDTSSPWYTPYMKSQWRIKNAYYDIDFLRDV